MCNKPLFLACVIIQKQPIVVNGWAVRELTLLRANVGKHGMHIICTQHFHNCSQTHNSLARPTPLNDSRSNKSHTLATTHPIYASLRHQTPNYCNKDTIQSLSTYASLHIRDQLIATKPPFNHCQRTHHSTSETNLLKQSRHSITVNVRITPHQRKRKQQSHQSITVSRVSQSTQQEPSLCWDQNKAVWDGVQ